MSFPRYPKYKDSGVEWLGEVPEHWEVSRLGFESWVRARLGWKGLKAEEYVDDGFAFLSTPNIKGVEIDFDNVNYIDQHRFDESPEIQLREGDVLLAKDGSTLGTVNVVRRLPCPATVNSSIAVITPGQRVDGIYMYYLFESVYMENTIQRIKGGMGVPHLFQEDLNKFYVPLPRLNEQQAIAAFLDRETATIDDLIAEQQRLIELLKEKRQAVISHAVTKGLNPDAPMKDSGIEWLGEVPEHWTLKRLKHVSPYMTVGIVVNPSTYVADDGLPFIYGGDIREGIIDWGNSRRISPESSELQAKTLLCAGDLLMVRVGAPGVTAVVPTECVGGNCASVMLIRQGNFSSQWLCYVLNTRIVRFQVEVVQYGAAQEQFNISHAVNFWVPVPPRKEQDEIAEATAAAVKQADALVAEAQSAIALLQERRSALISAAVTGQIDVRGLAGSEAA